MPIALSIAGSDSSGGAGIQADLKTFAAHQVYGASVIVALTAQNTTAVTAIHPVPADFVAAQIDAVFDDLAVEIGTEFIPGDLGLNYSLGITGDNIWLEIPGYPIFGHTEVSVRHHPVFLHHAICRAGIVRRTPVLLERRLDKLRDGLFVSIDEHHVLLHFLARLEIDNVRDQGPHPVRTAKVVLRIDHIGLQVAV